MLSYRAKLAVRTRLELAETCVTGRRPHPGTHAPTLVEMAGIEPAQPLRANGFTDHRAQPIRSSSPKLGPRPQSRTVITGFSGQGSTVELTWDSITIHPQIWCAREELNLHARRRQFLRLVCLPVSPLAQTWYPASESNTVLLFVREAS